MRQVPSTPSRLCSTAVAQVQEELPAVPSRIDGDRIVASELRADNAICAFGSDLGTAAKEYPTD